MNEDKPIEEIIKNLMRIPAPSSSDLDRTKAKAASKYGLQRIPSNSEVISMLKQGEKRKLLPLLRRKTTRTLSGVTVLAAMTKPYPCPQDEPCAYCPGGPKQGVPQSYTGFEPAAMRGLQNEFNPYLQVKTRIQQLKAIGHKVDKVELIIMGGTFPATPADYQTWFIQRCLDAITQKDSANLEEAKKNAETSRMRNVGITVETRPDWAKEAHVNQMLNMGVTRVEMGVQYPSDRIYHLVGRKHSLADVVEATRIMKDAGLKVVYHMMPGLPGTNREGDLEAFKTIFTNPKFKPDMVKIYPCLVLKATKAYDWYRQGTYTPYTNEEAVDLIAEVKRIIPPWIRVMRVQRDIPAPLIVAGVNKSNLRQLVQKKVQEKGFRCRCIRCREVGHRMRSDNIEVDPEKIQTLTMRYEASEGQEIFISAEDPENDALIGYLRLRVPSEKAHRPEVKATKCTIVRELHVYGSLVPVGKHSAKDWQHKGYGGILLAQAERITLEEYGFKKILVISALGTKQYYKRFGYDYDGVYMSKTLEN
ncbi:MAG: tRNA uridine(34) 5-carboxymethylaminomethyl modification radical SAM/GNAT enzyme Elp3 [Candidatus Bathyarchaeia archaeon]